MRSDDDAREVGVGSPAEADRVGQVVAPHLRYLVVGCVAELEPRLELRIGAGVPEDHVDMVGLDPAVARPLPPRPIPVGPHHVVPVTRVRPVQRPQSRGGDLDHHSLAVALLGGVLGRV